MKHFKLIILMLVLCIVVILAYQNSEAVSRTVHFRLNPVFFEESQTPELAFGLVMLMAFFLGVIVTGFCGMTERFRLKKKIKMCTKALEDKDQELNSLRILPITSDDVSPGQSNGA